MPSDPERCAYGDCNVPPAELQPRRMLDATTVRWYCTDHDPLADPELAALWVEAEV